MTDLSDEEIERALITGTNDAELRDILGPAYDALHAEAITPGADDADISNEIFGFGRDSKPLVYILPGIMGSQLAAQKRRRNDLIWFDPLEIRNGGVSQLKFGAEPHPILASGTFWTVYGLLRIRLAKRGYRVNFLPFDWRDATIDLGKKLFGQLDRDAKNGVVLVAHSMGGLVARQMAAEDATGVIKHVVTLGTPNYGSYSPVQVFRVSSPLLDKIGWLDKDHTPSQIANRYLRYFPGLIEMMPDAEKRPSERYFDPKYWPSGGARPTARALSAALEVKSTLPMPDARFHQIIGYGQETTVSAKLKAGEFNYVLSDAGDGTVPLDLAQVEGLPQYFVDASHAGMLLRSDVAQAVRELIEDQSTDALTSSVPALGFGRESAVQTVTDKAMRKTNRQMTRSDTPDALNVLSEFLEAPTVPVRDDVQNSADDTGFSEQDPEGRPVTIDGYPLSVLKRASQVWQDSAGPDERKTRGSQERETPQRKKKYAERKLVQLRAVVEEAPQSRVLPDTLQDIVVTSEAEHETAVNRLLNERVMGEAEDFLSVLFLKRAPIVSKSVGRVIRRKSEIGFGTAFLIAPGVLMTNHHVLPDVAEAERSALQLDYEINYRHREMRAESFELQPGKLFYASKNLDFAVVAVAPNGRETGRPLSDFGYLPLDGGEGKIKVGKPVNVIQHPNGERKQVVFREAELQDLPANQLAPDAKFSGAPQDIAAHYSADTKPGSSGSPVFSDAWEVIALHHSAVAVMKDGNFRMRDQTFKHPYDITDDDDVDWIANEGIRISRIIRHLEDAASGLQPGAAELIESVLAVGRHANTNGHFDRAMPVPVLSQTDPSQGGGAAFGQGQPEATTGTSNVATGITVQAPAADMAGGAVEITLPLKISVSLGAGYTGETGYEPDNVVSIAPSGQERRYAVEDLADRTGYDPDFLRHTVPLPRLLNTAPGRASEKLDGSGQVLTYDHYSVVMNAARRIAYFSAGNFDPSAPVKPTRDKEPWSFDPRIPESDQAGNAFYMYNPLDRGHLFRRTDGSWGETLQAALRADHDTYFWTNIAPQHKVFNRSKLAPDRDLWGNLENHVTAQANVSKDPVSIFNGPVFGACDRVHRDWAVPLSYWKIVIFSDACHLRALAFRLGQESLLTDLAVERIEPGDFGVYQIKVRDLERLTHLDFGVLRDADVLEAPRVTESFLPGRAEVRIKTAGDIVL